MKWLTSRNKAWFCGFLFHSWRYVGSPDAGCLAQFYVCDRCGFRGYTFEWTPSVGKLPYDYEARGNAAYWDQVTRK